MNKMYIRSTYVISTKSLPTCTISTEQTYSGLDYSEVQRANATKDHSDQDVFESVRQQREQQEREVGHVTQVTQHRGHDPSLRGLSHALDGGKQHDGLKNLDKQNRPITGCTVRDLL